MRTAIGKAPRGRLREVRPDDLGAAVLKGALERAGLEPARLDDVIMGCAMPEGPQGLNVARIATLRAGLPPSVPALTINRFCSSGLETLVMAADRIALGRAQAVLAGGCESMSLVPMTGNVFSPNPWLVEHHPQVYLGMGLTAEKVAQIYGVTREAQDDYALESHRRAVTAQQEGRFEGEILPYRLPSSGAGDSEGTDGGELFQMDEGPRPDTSLEALAKLKPAFKAGGTVTAGNASQRSDGAAALLLAERGLADKMGLTPQARLLSYHVAGVAPELMGIGPLHAIPQALEGAGLTLEEIDLFEVNEAFAAQLLPVREGLGIPPDKLNVNGGAIALGHPLGATGARLTVTLLAEMARREARYGLVSMCVGGGMGAAAIFEYLGS